MGKSSKYRRKPSPDTDPSSSPPPPASSLSPSTSSSDDYEATTSSKRRRRSTRRSRDSDDDDDNSEDEIYRRRSSSSSKKDKAGRKKKRKREKSRSRSEKRGRDRDRDRERRRKKERNRRSRSESKRLKDSESESGSSLGSSAEDYSEPERNRFEPEDVVRELFEAFPGVADDLRQLLQMIDSGQAVDIKGVSEKALMKHLNKLFLSLNLKETGDRVFLLRSNGQPTLEIVGPIISSQRDPQGTEPHSEPPNVDCENSKKEDQSVHLGASGDAPGPRRRVIGPEMPSAELLAAAAKLTEAEAELRDAELDQDDELFVGPPPPAVVTEAESSNEAERFEEVTRIIAAEVKSPYDILGVNHKMSTDNIKKKYWKLSLMVHPDKCPHPEANQAFIKLNKAFKDLQDPDKRKTIDDEIKKKEEEEEMKVELKSMREAALWRRSQGISMEGDDILLAELDVKGPPQRDEWMTTLPPERKPAAMSMHSTFFSKSGKEGRGDTSVWTDTPSDRAQKAKMNYLEAYNQATALAANEDDKKRANNVDAVLVDQYNKAKRSKSLIEKHREEEAEKRKKKKNKAKQPQNRKEAEQGEWVGNHPWKPWDREKDLTAGRQSVKLDSETMGDGLSSRFSSGNFQRSFL